MPDLPASLALGTMGGAIAASPHNTNYTAIQTAVNALIASLSGGSTNQVLLATDTDTIAWGGGYTTYTPTWTATGTAPAIGNATTVARYVQIGKLVHCYGSIVFGNTSTFGTGNYRFALPVTAAANAVTAAKAGTATLFDASTLAEGLVNVSVITTTTMALTYGATYLGASTAVGQTTPWTWAQSDIVSWNIVYEAA